MSISGVGGSSDYLQVSINNQSLVTPLYATVANATSDQLPSFLSNLDLSSSQTSQIEQILDNAQANGTSPSQVQSQINAVLTTAQRTQLQSELQQQQSAQSGSSSTSQNPFASLNLTSSQLQQIQQIFAKAKSGDLSQEEVQQQIAAVLTPTQQAQLESLTSSAASGNQTGGDATDSTSSSSSNSEVQNIQNQVLAAYVLNQQQFAATLGVGSGTTNS